MRRSDNPLDNIRIASPCSANWDEMFGEDRKRFCGDCKLNVYNLSGMTRRDAENLLIASEGRLCVRYYRRADGTVLTRDCPVGWQAVKKRVSRVAAAAFSMIAGVFTGVFAFNLLQERPMPAEQGAMLRPNSVGKTVPQVGEVQGMYKLEPVQTMDGPSTGNMVMGKPYVPSAPKTKVFAKNR
jgi:hypothetical protein